MSVDNWGPASNGIGMVMGWWCNGNLIEAELIMSILLFNLIILYLGRIATTVGTNTAAPG